MLRCGTFPTTLGGTTMTLVDATNTSYPVQMYYAGPNQVNYYVPTNAQPGPATVTTTSGDGTQTTGNVLIAPVAPGLFTATPAARAPRPPGDLRGRLRGLAQPPGQWAIRPGRLHLRR
jgi:uncharacterized protein (TIGR03437 family)